MKGIEEIKEKNSDKKNTDTINAKIKVQVWPLPSIQPIRTPLMMAPRIFIRKCTGKNNGNPKISIAIVNPKEVAAIRPTKSKTIIIKKATLNRLNNNFITLV